MTDGVTREIAEIQQVMRDDRASYNADTGMQSRLLELYEARETGAPASPRRQGGELAEIRKVMKTDLDQYWRDPDMQARFLQLLEAEEGQSDGEAGDDPGDLAAMPSPSEWLKNGNDPARYDEHDRMVREVNDILVAVDDSARDAVGDSFTALPRTVHAAAFAVLLDRRAVGVAPFHDTDMQRVSQVPAFRALAREWGSDAPRKMAALQERLWRVLDRLSDADASKALAWFNGLSLPAMAAVGRKLAR